LNPSSKSFCFTEKKAISEPEKKADATSRTNKIDI
jgi:hypothetical protein